jgi:hypothetical protein
VSPLPKTPIFARAFPNLTDTNHTVDSPRSTRYNCIAWASGENDVRLWPQSLDHEWPDHVQNRIRIKAFTDLYASIDYEVCENGDLEPGFEKVAVYADKKNVPTHAAVQLETGRWSSKLGDLEDISHDDPGVIADGAYGTVVVYMKRPRRDD